jgi:hypothetical protein
MTEPALSEVSSHEIHLKVEVFTMALYDSIVLLAASVAFHSTISEGQVLELVWGTTIGLTIAHLFAYRIATSIHRPFSGDDKRIAGAQLLGSLAVAVVCTIPVIVLPTEHELDALRYTIATLLGLCGYLASRSSGASRGRAILMGGVVAIVGFGVAILKYAIGSH